jgi:hypothetical protein
MRIVLTCSMLAELLLGLPAFLLSQSGDQPALEEKPTTYQGLSVSLSVVTPECKIGDALEVIVMFSSSGEHHRLFNPFFNSLLEQPGRILVRDTTGRLVNRLLDFHQGSRRTPKEGDYVSLLGGGFVGCKFSVYPWQNELRPETLLPGDYTLQLVLNGSLLGFTRKLAGEEVATSERVPFHIVK